MECQSPFAVCHTLQLMMQQLDGISKFGPGKHLAKLDINIIFHLLYVLTTDKHLLHSAYDQPPSYSTCQMTYPASLRERSIVHYYYLNDLLTVSPPYPQLVSTIWIHSLNVANYREGLWLKKRLKVPQLVSPFFGIMLDTVKLEICLPEDKLTRIKQKISMQLQKKKASKKQILLLLGLKSR